MQFFEVKTKLEAEELIRICPEVIAIDTEYVPGDPRTTRLLSIICADEDRAWIISPSLLPMLTPMLRARKLIFMQDYNRCDTIILNSNGCDLRNTYCLNLIDMHHLIDETKDHSLEARVWETFQDDYKTRLKGQYQDLEYQGKDGIYTYKLGMQDLKQLEVLHKLELLEHVRRTSNALIDTSINGILVDVQLMERTKQEMSGKINEYLPKLREEFKDACTSWELKEWQRQIDKRSTDRGKSGVKRPQFSFASDKQIAWLLYEYLELPVTERTKKRNPSTSYEALKSLSERHGGLQTLVEYKETKSIYSTFVEGMLDRVQDDRIYPNFNVSGTDTGRISHSNPNMANLPTDGVIRQFFIPTPGYSIIGADYTQLEVVVEANLTRDPNLLRIIKEGVSKHDITAQGLEIDRNTAKTLNFALQYGAGKGKIAKILNVSKQQAEDIYERYWKLYSGVRVLKEQTNKILEETGEVTNLFGRTRHFSKPKNEYELAKQQRQAYNFLIQGVAGDACNRAYWRFRADLKKSELGRGLFTVHDEIIAEVKNGHCESWKEHLEFIMEAVSEHLNFEFPLTAKAYGPLKAWSKT